MPNRLLTTHNIGNLETFYIKMENDFNRNITRQVVKVTAGIVGFLLVYVLLFVLSGIICYLIYPHWLEAVRGSQSLVLTIAVSILFWIIPAVFILNLVLFLFNRTKDERRERMEVSEADCPQLFAAIRELVRQEGCRMPRKVFVSPDVNACVFYNTAFWNIFIPVRKNLEVGAGLLAMQNVDELRAVLAHEFGHFSQDSMRVGSVLGVTNRIITNMAYGNSTWDRFLSKVTSVSGISIYTFILCLLLFGITIGIKKLLHILCKQTNKAYYELSRQMEYEADHIAANVVGSNVLASGLRKTELTAKTFNTACQMMRALASDEGRRIADLFEYHQTVTELMAERENVSVQADTLLEKQVLDEELRSRLIVNDIWSDHPSLDDRIGNLPADNDRPFSREPAMALMPPALRRWLTEYVYQLTEMDVQGLSQAEGEELRTWSGKYLQDNLIPEGYWEFLNHDLGPFGLDPKTFTQVENPFTDASRKVLKEFVVASSDYSNLKAVVNGDVEASEVVFDGIPYTKQILPLLFSRQTEHYNSLVNAVNAIDMAALQYTYAAFSGNRSAQELVLSCYRELFAIDDLQKDKAERINQSLSLNNPSQAADSDDGEFRRNAIKLTVKEVLEDGCRILAPAVPKQTLDGYMSIAAGYDNYSIEQMLDAASSLMDLSSRAANRVKTRLGHLFEEAATGNTSAEDGINQDAKEHQVIERLLAADEKELIADELFKLSMAFEYGYYGYAADKQKAMDYLSKAARLGHIAAQYYMTGFLMPKDGKGDPEFLHWLKAAAAQGDKLCCYNLAIAIQRGELPEGNDISGRNAMFRKSAELGYVPAFSAMAVMYAKGEGVEANKDIAKYWAMIDYMNAKDDDARGKSIFNDLLEADDFRDGDKIDYDRILRWAAEAGERDALNTMGARLLQSGDETGAGMMEKAADMGHRVAACNLAVRMLRQEKPDYTKARALLIPAAGWGSAAAQYHLAVMYGEGLGVERDLQKCWLWLEKSLNQCSNDARGYLVHLYEDLDFGKVLPDHVHRAENYRVILQN